MPVMSPDPDISPQEAAAYLLTLKRAATSFLDFVKALCPDFNLQPFHLDLIRTLDLLERGALTNSAGLPVYKLLVTLPPRMGKSTFCTQLFPLYCIARMPTRQVMSAAYNEELAKTFGAMIRQFATINVTSQIFPSFILSKTNTSSTHWRTTAGGAYYGVGLGGTTSGRAANVLIIDDPYRSRSEADSPTVRNAVWSYYTSALRTRKEPCKDGSPAIEIVIHTRWHPDDLAGRIQALKEWKDGEWLHLNYPAIRTVDTGVQVRRCNLPPDDPRYLPRELLVEINLLKRAKRAVRVQGGSIAKEFSEAAYAHAGEPIYVRQSRSVSLWEERFPVSDLLKLRALDAREFDALYQQSPTIIGGNLIKSSWWRYYDTSDTPPSFLSVIIAADTAFKTKTTSDYSVLLAAGLDALGDIYLLDLIREKLEYPDLKRRLMAFANRYRPLGLRGIHIEDRASGQSIIQELRASAPAPVIPFKNPPNSDKVARLASITPIIQNGNILLPKAAPWLDNFVTEASQFPSSAHDDQMDALFIAVDTLSRIPISTIDILSKPIGSVLSTPSITAPFTSSLAPNPAGWQGNWKGAISDALGE